MSDVGVKIALTGPDGDIETLWAYPAGEEGHYVLDNVPWYAYGVSLGDTVEAAPDVDGQLQMIRVVQKSGNRTLRVLLEVSSPSREWTYESRALIDGICARGCDIENMNQKLVAITASPAVDLLGLGSYIDAAGFQFEYADPTFEELFPDYPSDSTSAGV